MYPTDAFYEKQILVLTTWEIGKLVQPLTLDSRAILISAAIELDQNQDLT